VCSCRACLLCKSTQAQRRTRARAMSLVRQDAEEDIITNNCLCLLLKLFVSAPSFPNISISSFNDRSMYMLPLPSSLVSSRC